MALDIERYRFVQQGKNGATLVVRQAKPKQGHFIKGPIPLDWIARTASISGKALAVGLALWYQVGFNRGNMAVPMTAQTLRVFSISPSTALRVYRQMQREGLIKIQANPGQAHRITILPLDKPKS